MNITASSTPPGSHLPDALRSEGADDRLGPVADDEPEGMFDDPEADAHALCEVAAALRSAPATAVPESQLAAWIEAVVDHDERALAALYDATLSRVYGLVKRMVRSAALAEEVVEDTYFQVWRQAVRFDPARGKALTWLLGMARSRAIDTLRREARFQHDSLDDDTMLDAASSALAADDLLDVARCHADLHRAMLLLDAQPRQLVALAFFRGLSHDEIASATQLPLGTVKSQIRRALITLRQLLGDGRPLVLAS